jgi:hypothetical protein
LTQDVPARERAWALAVLLLAEHYGADLSAPGCTFEQILTWLSALSERDIHRWFASPNN